VADIITFLSPSFAGHPPDTLQDTLVPHPQISAKIIVSDDVAENFIPQISDNA